MTDSDAIYSEHMHTFVSLIGTNIVPRKPPLIRFSDIKCMQTAAYVQKTDSEEVTLLEPNF